MDASSSYASKEAGSQSYYERSLKTRVGRMWHDAVTKMIKALMDGIKSDSHLDIGCNDGVRIRIVKSKGRILGIDIDREALSFAKKRKIEVCLMSAEKLAFADNSFELVTMIESLEHLEHPTLALYEASRVLKKGGFFIIVVPNDNLLFRIIWWFWTKFGLGSHWKEKHLFKYSLWSHTKHGLSLIDRLINIGLIPERTESTNLNMVVGVRAIKLYEKI